MVFCCEVEFNEMFSSVCTRLLNLTFDVIILDAKHNALIMTPLFIDSFTLLLLFFVILSENAQYFFIWMIFSLLFFLFLHGPASVDYFWNCEHWHNGELEIYEPILSAPHSIYILCECNLLFISHTFSPLF